MLGTNAATRMALGTDPHADLRRGFIWRTIDWIGRGVREHAARARAEELDRIVWSGEAPRELVDSSWLSRDAVTSSVRWARPV
jgi:hypothetical protein